MSLEAMLAHADQMLIECKALILEMQVIYLHMRIDTEMALDPAQAEAAQRHNDLALAAL